MTTFNEKTMEIIPMTKQEMRTIYGGYKWWKVALFGLGGCLLGEAVSGAYQAGYDAGSQNCE